jgi:CRP-like cAMP-binding protein
MTTLPAIGWAAELKEDDRDLLASYGEFIPVQEGTVLIEEGKAQTNLYVVVAGALKVVREVYGQRDVVAVVKPGESIGEVGVFEGGPASATVISIEFTQLWKIDRAQLQAYFDDNPGAANKLLVALVSLLGARLRKSGFAALAQN